MRDTRRRNIRQNSFSIPLFPPARICTYTYPQYINRVRRKIFPLSLCVFDSSLNGVASLLGTNFDVNTLQPSLNRTNACKETRYSGYDFSHAPIRRNLLRIVEGRSFFPTIRIKILPHTTVYLRIICTLVSRPAVYGSIHSSVV